jgi:hypothetical protein
MEKTGQMLRLQIFSEMLLVPIWILNVKKNEWVLDPLYASDDFFISYWNELNLNYPQIYIA